MARRAGRTPPTALTEAPVIWRSAKLLLMMRRTRLKPTDSTLSKVTIADRKDLPATAPTPEPSMIHGHAKASLVGLGLAALGIVFGDIGTSPLYTLKTVLDVAGKTDAPTVLGILSLLVWTLVIVTTAKYVVVAMSIDNDGEGGILALMALVGDKARKRPAIVAIGLFGAAPDLTVTGL